MVLGKRNSLKKASDLTTEAERLRAIMLDTHVVVIRNLPGAVVAEIKEFMAHQGRIEILPCDDLKLGGLTVEQKYLDDIRAREQKATPGPWHHDWYTYDEDGPLSEPGPSGEIITFAVGSICTPDIGHIRMSDDADFVANARQDIPALLAEVERLRADSHGALVVDGERIQPRDYKAACTYLEVSNEMIERLRQENEQLKSENERLAQIFDKENKLAGYLSQVLDDPTEEAPPSQP